MNPSPSPTPLDVFVHSGPAEWWQILAALGPLAVLVGALLAAFIGWNTLRQRTTADAKSLAQKREADDRSEWWKRTQWAIDSSMSDEPDRAKLGLRVMSVLAESKLAGPEELKIITSAWVDPLEVAEQARTGNPVQGEYVGSITVPPPIPEAAGPHERPEGPGRVDDGTEPGDNEATNEDEE
ncbi:hypothetical protein Achl_4030 (plasmid) [Pseudarthrobacter chlorophenolicus A6]|uniref:Uncharacterized protein n=1 Tax=Pseudarthrobacter chlorophenolicus (strain ATCC 700700 / DSM 12829 / CIP 107037 / JCM 12360 / KCTC 9906 / NCIMB 13794 / A6) TaxID=452863 RepID=B8HHT4_PSECP|nr:hypothetical protein [Pseudarthrobacter chlorophenolicus]ACL41981.1 hypothetical protein Achl_4030 [Pseudarthrobacter chlorophenolicus A6]SDQ19818.1 hypothetical protein SAMN04489738_0681 [Pseudarthrobacter chlorophenolicus]